MGMHTMHTLGSPNSSPTAADFPAPQQQQQQHHTQQQQQHPHALSRQHSFQHPHGGFRGDPGGGSGTGPPGQQQQGQPPPPSPGGALTAMDMFDDGAHDAPSGRGSAKRQRLDERSMGLNGTGPPGGGADALALMSSVSSPGGGPGGGSASSLAVPKKSSRARSDSAPLGYATAPPVWQQGAGLSPGVGTMGRPRSGSGMGMMPRGIPNIGNMTRANNASTPLLAITTADADIGR